MLIEPYETIIPVFQNLNKEALDVQKVHETTLDKDEHKYVTLDDDEAWDKFFKFQNNVSTNITNTRKANPYVHKDSDGVYMYTARDENKYNGKYIIGPVTDKIQTEILKILGSDTVKSIALKESKDEDDNVMAAARIVLSGSTKRLNISKLLNDAICKRYRVGSITFCLPDKNKTRGVRCRIGKDGVRVYEVANGSYQITLDWEVRQVGGCCGGIGFALISISDDGSVKLLERSGVSDEQFRAHKKVKVGRQYEARFLSEALMLSNLSLPSPSHSKEKNV